MTSQSRGKKKKEKKCRHDSEKFEEGKLQQPKNAIDTTVFL
jgi:hypothetical protein